MSWIQWHGGPDEVGPRLPRSRVPVSFSPLSLSLSLSPNSDPVQGGQWDRGEVVRLRRASRGGRRSCVEAVGCVERYDYEEAARR